MYCNSIVDHYGISKNVIIILAYMHVCVYYTNSNTKLSMVQLLYTIKLQHLRSKFI